MQFQKNKENDFINNRNLRGNNNINMNYENQNNNINNKMKIILDIIISIIKII